VGTSVIRRLYRTLIQALFAAALVFAPAGAAPAKPATLTGTVTWIYDADTLEVAPHGRVRLLGIDAPEKSASDRDRNFTKFGIAARRLRSIHGAGLAWCLHNVKGSQVSLISEGSPRDRHGRLLAYVRLPDGRLLNRVLLEEGLVIVYRRFPFDLKADFLAAEERARHDHVGLWSR
jgi:micrococcal nuclease